MSTWLDEIGRKKFTEKEVKLVAGLLSLLKESEVDGIDADDKESFIEMLDTAIYNVTELKKIVTENL